MNLNSLRTALNRWKSHKILLGSFTQAQIVAALDEAQRMEKRLLFLKECYGPGADCPNEAWFRFCDGDRTALEPYVKDKDDEQA